MTQTHPWRKGLRLGDAWQCACKTWNKADRKRCSKCGDRKKEKRHE